MSAMIRLKEIMVAELTKSGHSFTLSHLTQLLHRADKVQQAGINEQQEGINEQARRMCPFNHWASTDRPPNFDPISPLYVYPGTRRQDRAATQNAHAATAHAMAPDAAPALTVLERQVLSQLDSPDRGAGRRRRTNPASSPGGANAPRGGA